MIHAAELVVLSVVAIPALVRQWSNSRHNAVDGNYTNPLILRYAAVYLAVMRLLLWVTALPAYFGAVDGLTADGDPVGSLWYTIVCPVIACLSVAAAATAATAARRSSQESDALAPTHAASGR